MSRAAILFVVITLLAGCAPAGSHAPDGSAPGTATAPSTAPGKPDASPPQPRPPAARPEISIERVTPANPVLVEGLARTFENAVTVRLLDAQGAPVSEAHVVSRGEMGQHNPYEAQLWVVRDPGAQMTVEALEYSARDGSVRSRTTRTVATPADRLRVELVFPVTDCTRFATFQRSVPRTVSVARLLAEALLRGPTDAERAAGAHPPFPQGSDVRSVILRDGVLTVDLNERLQNVGGSCAATAIRESLTRTLQMLPAVDRVVITAAGSEKLALQP